MTETPTDGPDAAIDAVLADLPAIEVDPNDPQAQHVDLASSIHAVSDVHTRLQQRLSDLSN